MSAPTGNKVFAPAIFFIAFREALEASLVIGILTGTLENVVGVKNGDQNGRALVKKLRKYVSSTDTFKEDDIAKTSFIL